MALAPFREFLPLIVLDGNFDLPQHLFAGFTDRRAQGGDGGRRVEVEHGQEIFMDEGFLRVQPATGQKGVSGADQGGVSERNADVEVIVPLQEGTVNDTENVPLIGIPVFIRQTSGDSFQLFRKGVRARNIVAVLQCGGNGGIVLLPILPEVWSAGVFPAAGVGYIKHIADLCLVSAGVNERDSPAAPADVTPHGPVPEVIFGTGRGVWPLGIDHELLMVGVLIQPSGGGEKCRPLL